MWPSVCEFLGGILSLFLDPKDFLSGYLWSCAELISKELKCIFSIHIQCVLTFEHFVPFLLCCKINYFSILVHITKLLKSSLFTVLLRVIGGGNSTVTRNMWIFTLCWIKLTSLCYWSWRRCCTSVRYESSSLCVVRSQLSHGAADEERARPWCRPQYVQAGRVALETVAGLRRTVASLCRQRWLPAGARQCMPYCTLFIYSD